LEILILFLVVFLVLFVSSILILLFLHVLRVVKFRLDFGFKLVQIQNILGVVCTIFGHRNWMRVVLADDYSVLFLRVLAHFPWFVNVLNWQGFELWTPYLDVKTHFVVVLGLFDLVKVKDFSWSHTSCGIPTTGV